MVFSIPTHWVWDFWLADDGEQFHLYYLHAPRSLGNEHLRHRNAAIGHATSHDLVRWVDHGPVLLPGVPGDADATATWTGCVVPDPEGGWVMFYTGSRFLDASSAANIESICMARSGDLQSWHKLPEAVVNADPRWYETLADGTWREEAWRDPWVFRGDDGRWHMLITARAKAGEGDDRGVVGHAVSDDLYSWRAAPPLSGAGSGFAHLEVPQLVDVEGHRVLLFSCDTTALAGRRTGELGGVWCAPVDDPAAGFSPERGYLLVDERLYAGRIVKNRSGTSVLIGFETQDDAGQFAGVISDPVPLRWDRASQRVVVT